MYKNPELSAQAKNLRAALQTLGWSVTHAQALELMAKAHGARTLHVAQAKKAKQGLDIAAVAERQAADVMFSRLGRFAGNVRGLLEAIRAGFALEASEGSRAVEHAMFLIFEDGDAPRVSEMFESFRLEELPGQFEQLVHQLGQTLAMLSGAPAPQNPSEYVLYEGPMSDWRVQEGEDLAELPEGHRTTYAVRVARSGHQLYVDISRPHASPDELEGTDQLSLFIEVNQGKPCVHVTNDRYGDQVLSVFGVSNGLYLRPDEGNLWIATGACPEGTALAALQSEECEHGFGRNHAFIVTG